MPIEELKGDKLEVISDTQLKITKSVEEIIDKEKLIKEKEHLTFQIIRLQEQLDAIDNLLTNFK